jgi:hypothetical protein
MTATVFAAFFLGQGGTLFSMPFAAIARKAHTAGFGTWVYPYTDLDRAREDVAAAAKGGSKIALIGYSLGASTMSELQSEHEGPPIGLAIGIAASTLGENYPINRARTRRAVLYAGTDFLSSGAQRNGYDEVVHVTAGFGIPVWSHLNIPASHIVIDGVLAELAKLKGS